MTTLDNHVWQQGRKNFSDSTAAETPVERGFAFRRGSRQLRHSTSESLMKPSDNVWVGIDKLKAHTKSLFFTHRTKKERPLTIDNSSCISGGCSRKVNRSDRQSLRSSHPVTFNYSPLAVAIKTGGFVCINMLPVLTEQFNGFHKSTQATRFFLNKRHRYFPSAACLLPILIILSKAFHTHDRSLISRAHIAGSARLHMPIIT